MTKHTVEEWRSRPLTRGYPYVFVDGIYLKRAWGGSFENVAVMVAIGVNDDGYREVIGAAEGFTESAECWREFLSWLRACGLAGVRMFTGDKAAAMTGAIAEVFPGAAHQRCTVHFYRNVLSKVPKSKRSRVAAMLKAIHAQESFDASMEKAAAVAASLDEMRLAAAAKCVREGAAETLTYTHFPMRHWAAHPHEQRHRAAEPRDQPPDAGRGHVPRRQERAHAGGGQAQVRGRQRMGVEKVPGRVAAGRVTIPTADSRLLEFAQESGQYPKVVCRTTKDTYLMAKRSVKCKYSSYGRDRLSSRKRREARLAGGYPNGLRLTKINEISMPTGKLHLSPHIDRFDGTHVAWSSSTSLNTELANERLYTGASKL